MPLETNDPQASQHQPLTSPVKGLKSSASGVALCDSQAYCLSNRTIICIASNWFYDPTSKHHVMQHLARRNNQIVWVNYHASRRPSLTAADAGAIVGKLRQVIQGPRRVADNITVVTPLVLPLPGSRAATAINRRLLVRQIRSVLRDLPPQPIQLWSFAPDVDFLVGQFDEEAVVYYCVDDFAEFTGYDRHSIADAEAKLCAGSDLVITTSQTLFDKKRRLNPRTVLITHGVDHTHFARALDPNSKPPSDIAGIPRPILGFWGLIQDWVDIDLLASIAQARPDWSLVLVGEAAVDLARFAKQPNVHLLGRRPYADLPSYARAFDLGLIPFRDNALTRAVNPIKLREYLSAGLPVISSRLPEATRYADWVRLAVSPDEWIAAAESEIARDTPALRQARSEAMATETWEAKIAELESHLGRNARVDGASVLPLLHMFKRERDS